VIALHNLADRPAAVRLGGGGKGAEKVVELLGDQPYELVGIDEEIDLEPYGYRWFRTRRAFGGRTHLAR